MKRRSILAHLCAGLALFGPALFGPALFGLALFGLAGIDDALAGERGMSVQKGVLDTPAQIAAERTLLALLEDPEVKAIQRQMLEELAGTETAKGPHGMDGLPAAIAGWTATLILRELAGDPAAPQFLWTTDDSAHDWHGFTVPPRTASGDNPDFIYRATFFGGAGKYEIDGQFDLAHRPAQLTLEFMRSTPGDRMVAAARSEKSVDFGNQIAMVTDRDLTIDAQGRFRLTVSNAPGAMPGHVQVPAGPVAITVRDALSDWTQQPVRLTIRRLDQAGALRDAAAMRAQILADLPGHLRFWGTFPDKWYAGQPRNVFTGPVARDGGWGFVGGVRFTLAPDEAIVIRTRRGGAAYTGVQASDLWAMTPDVQTRFSSINAAQAVADPDGDYTYVAAASDPGIANWLDIHGFDGLGGVSFRWQGMSPGAKAEDLVRDFRIVKLGELEALDGVARVTPEERKQAFAKRIRDYRVRLGE